MKKTLIAAAVAAATIPVAATAQNGTVFSAPNGEGQVLLFPYYSATDGNNTFFQVANTTSRAKVIKIRVREGVESEDVLDWQVYLSPYDYWVARITAAPDDETTPPNVFTPDSSCTVPTLSSEPLRPNRIPSSYTGNVNLRMAEGHIEVYELFTFDNITDSTITDLWDSIVHVNGTPLNCDAAILFNANQTDPILTPQLADRGGVRAQVDDPTGGIWGHAAVFNPTDGTWFSYEAEALVNFAGDPIFWPQNGRPALNPANYTADEVLLANPSAPLNFDLPDISTPGFSGGTAAVDQAGVVVVQAAPTILTVTSSAATEPEQQRDLVSAAILSSNIANEYLSGDDWSTDWVFTFPGRYAYRTPDPAGLLDPLTEGYELDSPFSVSVSRVTGEGCVPVNVSGVAADSDGNIYAVYGREEESATSNDIDFSPGTFEGFSLCFEVNVIGVNDAAPDNVGPSEALRSKAIYKRLGSPFTFGWVDAGLTQTFSEVSPGMIGLPFIGFAAITDNRTDTKRGGAFNHALKRGRTQ